MPKYVVEGWIRARLIYLTPENVGIEQFEHYSSKYTEFGDTEELKKLRIKYFEFTDKVTKTTFSASFAYDQLGIEFCVSTDDISDKSKAFQALVERGVNGYKSFRDYFLTKICPSNIKVQFAWEGLLLSLYNFDRDEDSIAQQKATLNGFVEFLKKYTAKPKKAVFAEELRDPKPRPSIKRINLQTMADVQEENKSDFDEVILTIGEENVFDVKHHMFATSFFLHDMTSSLNRVAEWGFRSSLILTDFHFENKDFNDKIERFEKKAKEARQKRFPFGSDVLQEEFINLEKRSRFLDEELEEFENLSNQIYAAVKESENSDDIFDVLGDVKSLPHSLDFAYGVLNLRRLGVFKGYKNRLEDIRSDLNIVDIKLRHFELFTVISLLVLSSVVVFIGYNWYKDTTDSLLSPIANTLQVLTFIVAVMLLAFRQRKR